MDICLERDDLLAFRLCYFTLCRLDFYVPFPYGVCGGGGEEMKFDCIGS